MTNEQAEIRELFIDELEQVHGGGPVEDLIRELKDPATTMACCEEGNDCGGSGGCSSEPW